MKTRRAAFRFEPRYEGGGEVRRLMSADNPSLEVWKGEAVRAVRGARPWIVPLARLGYAAKGAVYLLVGAEVTLAAPHRGGRVTDFDGALAIVYSRPLGGAPLAALALGLAGYALCCVLRTSVYLLAPPFPLALGSLTEASTRLIKPSTASFSIHRATTTKSFSGST